MTDLDLLYCAREIVTGTSFLVMTALSKRDKAGALVEFSSPPGSRMVSSIGSDLTGLRKLFRTSAAGKTCQRTLSTIRLKQLVWEAHAEAQLV